MVPALQRVLTLCYVASVGRLQSIQILRLIAACLVIIVHASGTWSPGFVGVDIFFVISGFIITRMMPGRTAGQFLRSRVTRIYPFYWLMLLPKTIEKIAGGEWDLSRALTSITLWPAFGAIQFPYLILGWTLCFEMLFYVGATLILLDRRALFLLPALYLLAMIGAFATGHPALRFLGNPLVIEFALGVMVALIPFRSAARQRHRGPPQAV